MESKKWYTSLTYWGVAILGLCSVLLPALGKADLGQFLAGEQTGIVQWLTALGDLIGGLSIFIGRWRAHTKLTV